MSSLIRSAFLTTQVPNLIFKRFRGKLNIQRPQKNHFARALLFALTKPIYPKKERVRPCPLNTNRKNEKSANPYEQIIAREVKHWFDQSKMVGIVHINPIIGEDFFKARVAFHKNGMQLKKYGTSIMKLALGDTKYENLLPLQNGTAHSTGYIFCPEHNNVNSMLKVLKKIPQMHLLCGIAEDRLLSKNELVKYASLPDIQIARSQFVNVLNMAASQLVQNLESHQSNLVNILDAHVRENQKPSSEEAKVEEEKDKS